MPAPLSETPIRSIHEIPLESGGRIARQGFDFQDHVAAGICLDMLENPSLLEVWCESQDDVTLLWDAQGTIAVEFVQVKGADLDGRWSVAELTRGKGVKTKRKPSLIEQSLARASCREAVHFRVVTFTDVTADLTVLKTSRENGRDVQKLNALQQKLQKKKLLIHTSSNGTTIAQWVERCLWQKQESNEAQANSNKFRLEKHIKGKFGLLLALEQLSELYTFLLEKVKAASSADLDKISDAYKIKRIALETWIKEATDRVLFKGPGVLQSKMRTKMERCGISPEIIEKAVLLRIGYVTERVSSGYSTVTPLTRLELKVIARMQIERVALEVGAINEVGSAFHARCLRALEEERGTWGDKLCPDAAYFQGYMYELTNRCQHSFDLAK